MVHGGFSMPRLLQAPQKPCTCQGACTGYKTQSTCPPLIVLAVLAVAAPTVMGDSR
jgi:hypothetical protein